MCGGMVEQGNINHDKKDVKENRMASSSACLSAVEFILALKCFQETKKKFDFSCFLLEKLLYYY
jgi:hypothetical protein